jgi:hypothetical protein
MATAAQSMVQKVTGIFAQAAHLAQVRSPESA